MTTMTIIKIFSTLLPFIILLIAVGGAIAYMSDNRPFWIAVTIICILVAVICVSLYYTHTATGIRSVKDTSSELHNGINRTVTVYDLNGDVLATYKGKFDIDTSQDVNRIKFDDEEGKRHIIYNTTGTVIIDED